MTQTQIFLTGLRALRNTLASAVDQIDVILDLAEKPSDVSTPTMDECPHPPAKRLARPSMGHLGKYYCTACNKDVEE